ncbi:hypothetical protein BLD44_008275 [Mastigocladus laminosus UU774]|nr:hypothetical protein BLD44_008275 [Mastigocladus laminosus UU774]
MGDWALGIGHGAWGMGHWAWGMGHGALGMGAWGMGHGGLGTDLLNNSPHTPHPTLSDPRSPILIFKY